MQLQVTSNAVQVAREIAGVAAVTHTAVRAVVRSEGAAFQTMVKANASGRPGPRAQTGDYRRSIGMQVREGIAMVTAEVGTNAPQGRRLEFGFWGLADSLGRVFHQPAFPHFGPAADEMEHRFPTAVELTVGRALR